MFARCSPAGPARVICAHGVGGPFTDDWYSGAVSDAWLQGFAHSPWALAAMAAMVFGDAFLVVVPGEIAVTTLGALAVAEGSPPLLAVVLVAALAAMAGDCCCYLIGRFAGVDRMRWARRPRIAAGLAWANAALDRRGATVLFTARFVPFARLAVTLAAGASRMPFGRYIALVMPAAAMWALYQGALGAAVAALVPGGTLVAVLASIALAVAVGAGADAIVARSRLGRGGEG